MIQSKRMVQYIYIISNPSFPGWLKIGRTTDIDKRLTNYQTGDPFRKYKLEYIINVREPLLYELVFADHCDGEWTQLNLSECIKTITSIRSFEIENKPKKKSELDYITLYLKYKNK